MDFVANQKPQQEAMKKTLGIQDILELYRDIPKELLVKGPFSEGISEYEGLKAMEEIASKNKISENYLGFGAYEHQIPAATSALIKRSEFLTSYTPYQAEASQGLLQAIFEYQSMIAALTGLDVSNASVYDGASACAEAALMALRHTKRDTLVVYESVHPFYRAVIKQYTESLGTKIKIVPFDRNTFKTDRSGVDRDTAAVMIQSPNVFGRFEDVSQAKKSGALSILIANPIVYGAFPSASELGADIAVGDLQPLGIPLKFGGPYAGYMACKEELMRQLPGRLVGKTTDAKGYTGYTLTLQAREQHIRREKATSNICTNQTLVAIASLVTALWYGPEGLKKLALANYQKSAYLRKALGIEGDDFFNEFPVKGNYGIPLECYFTGLKDFGLIAVTETKSKEMLDRFARSFK